MESWELFLDDPPRDPSLDLALSDDDKVVSKRVASNRPQKVCQCKKKESYSLFLTGVYLEIANESPIESIAAQLQAHTESYLYIREKKLGFYTQLPAMGGYRLVQSKKAFGLTMYTLQRGSDIVVCFSDELKDQLTQRV